jgi:RNA polymerase sigma-70 factor (ECF subfamily)
MVIRPPNAARRGFLRRYHSPMTGDARARHRTRLAARLYAEHSKQILAFFRCSRQMSMADAGDFLQQTFAELLKTLENHPELEIDNPRAFLFTIARRRLSADYKRRVRQPTVEADKAEEQPSQARADDLELLASLRSDQRLLLRAMRRLTEEDNARADAARSDGAAPEPVTVSDHQLLLYLRFWAGLTLAETAQVLGIPPGTVSGRQYRAMQLLRRRVEELDAPDEDARRTSTTVLHGWQRALEREAGEMGRNDGDGG